MANDVEINTNLIKRGPNPGYEAIIKLDLDGNGSKETQVSLNVRNGKNSDGTLADGNLAVENARDSTEIFGRMVMSQGEVKFAGEVITVGAEDITFQVTNGCVDRPKVTASAENGDSKTSYISDKEALSRGYNKAHAVLTNPKVKQALATAVGRLGELMDENGQSELRQSLTVAGIAHKPPQSCGM